VSSEECLSLNFLYCQFWTVRIQGLCPYPDRPLIEIYLGSGPIKFGDSQGVLAVIH